jgi:serine/threonine protein kinase
VAENEIELAEAEKYVAGRYLCKKKLGSGGFGEVWSCVDVIAKQQSQKMGKFTEGDN